MRSVIKRRLNGSVQYRVFLWPGLWGARLGFRRLYRNRASERLRKKLSRWQEVRPGASFFIVAHSEGGNLVLSTLKSSSGPAGFIKGIVLVATSFIEQLPSTPVIASPIFCLSSDADEVHRSFMLMSYFGLPRPTATPLGDRTFSDEPSSGQDVAKAYHFRFAIRLKHHLLCVADEPLRDIADWLYARCRDNQLQQGL